MHKKSEKAIAGIDISISIIIITIFISIIANLIVNINLNYEETKRKTTATSYAIQEIEKIKAIGYKENYNNKGINDTEIIQESDILDSEKNFTGYHKKIFIKDYVLIKQDYTKTQNLVKQIIIEISYKVGNKDRNVSISTYIAKDR